MAFIPGWARGTETETTWLLYLDGPGGRRETTWLFYLAGPRNREGNRVTFIPGWVGSPGGGGWPAAQSGHWSST